MSVVQAVGIDQDYSWSVVLQPDGANLVLTPALQNNGVILTPTVATTADSGLGELTRLTISQSIKMINSAWSLVNAPVDCTDMSDTAIASEREQFAFDKTRDYQKLMIESPKHLFVNSAGNGVKGAEGTAIDGRYHSPAVHYSEIGQLNFLPNVLFVATIR